MPRQAPRATARIAVRLSPAELAWLDAQVVRGSEWEHAPTARRAWGGPDRPLTRSAIARRLIQDAMSRRA